MKAILALLIFASSFLVTSFVDAADKEAKAATDEMRDATESLRQDIADLEKELAAAKAENRMEDANDIERELEMMKRTLSTMETGIKRVEQMPSAVLERFAASEGRTVPEKDAVRIARVRRNILSDTELAAFVRNVHAAVEAKIGTKLKSFAVEMHDTVRKKYPSPAALANAATGFWMMQRPEVALWLMGKACTEDADPDNLNNYAAFLIMAGAEEAALPILMKLNERDPNNSTILNNIGQAWFGLGDLEEADKHLKEAIRFFGVHSQANYTRCLIEESRGNKTEAIAAVARSIKGAYSTQKENTLRRLGGKRSDADIGRNMRMPQDPLGLHKFNSPNYPRDVRESEGLEPQWKAFLEACSQRSEDLRVREEKARADLEKLSAARDDLMRSAEKKVMEQPGAVDVAGVVAQAATLGMVLSPLGEKASKMLQASTQEGHYMRAKERYEAALLDMHKEVQISRKLLEKAELDIHKKYEEEFGEGRRNPESEQCSEIEGARDSFLAAVNPLMSKVHAEVLQTERRQINENTYFRQFIEHPLEFELTKIVAKQKFLSILTSLQPEFQPRCNPQKDDSKPQKRKLPEFEEIHCDHKIELDFFFVTGEFTCNKAEMKYDAIVVRGEHVSNLNTGKIIRGTAEMGVSVGLKERKLGPLKAEARAGAGAFVEYDEHGITDWGPRAEVRADLGANVEDPTEVRVKGEEAAVGEIPTIHAGIETRWGWNAGGSLEGKGLLHGVHVEF